VSTTSKQPGERPPSELRPELSIVVPTYNRRERLERVLRSLANQDVDVPFEVIVVSDGSTDGTHEYFAHGDLPLPIVALTQPNQGPAAARNRGVEASTGDYVLFIDDDVVATPGLVKAHLDAHQRLGPAAVVIGPMLDPPDHDMSPWVAWEQAMLAKQYSAMERGEFAATARQFYTGNASLRREHMRAIGGFDTSFRRAEDVELAYRLDDLGLRFHFEPTAVGLHYAERSYEAWRRTAYDYGRNDIVFARDHGRTWIFRFIKDSAGWRHPMLRLITSWSVALPTVRSATMAVTDKLIVPDRRWPGDPVRRGALSLAYSIAYHHGLSDELGSISTYRHVLRHGHHPDGER
jgi:glycosyltransferase involved in cell wall biosynthesis